MVEIYNGNLLDSDCNVIIHQTDCFNKMSNGISAQIRNRYFEAFIADKNFPKRLGSERLGYYSKAITKDNRIIYNMYSKLDCYRNDSINYQAMYNALKFIVIDCTHSGLSRIKIGLPYIIDGGDLNKVKSIVERVSSEKNQPIYLYKS